MMRPATLALTAAALILPLAWLARLAWPSSPRAGGDPVAGRRSADLLVLSADGWAASELSLHDRSAAPPPALDQLAGRGLETFLAFAPVAESPAGVACALTGRLPDAQGAAPRGPSVLSQLALGGWRTALVSDLPLQTELGLGAHLEQVVEWPGASTNELTAAALKWLPPADERSVALWLHLGPRVDATAAVERALTELLAGLQQRRRDERTVLVVLGTSGDGGAAGPGRHARLGVPLIVRLPRLTAAGEVRMGPCATLDLAPTLCAFFGVPSLPGGAGRSWYGGSPDALLSGLGFSGVAPVSWREGQRQVLGLRAMRELVTDEPGAYDALADPTSRNNLLGTTRGDELLAEHGAALQALSATQR